MRRLYIHAILSVIGFVLAVVISVRDFSKNNCTPENISEQSWVKSTYASEAMRWYNNQRAYPSGHIPVDWREKALNQIEQNNLQKSSLSNQTLSWNNVGPDNVGGRVRSIAIDPTNSNVMYCGSVSGGVWKTTNAGNSWFATNDFAANLVIGCLAIDPTNPNIIYAGTGEGYFNVDALRGMGVLKSTDGGTNWLQLTNFSNLNPTFSYYYINKLIIRPDNPNTIYAAMIGGVWKTTDAGTSWNKLSFPGGTTYFCMDLIMNPGSPDIMYAAFGLFSADGIYKTVNGGTNWSKLSGGLPTAGFNRISLGIAPSNPSVVYAVFDSATTHNTHSIYKTTNDGTNWTPVAKPYDPSVGASHLGGQGWYNNVVAVKPTSPDTVIVGGINLFMTTNGGTNWLMLSDGTIYSNAPYVHVDQHAIMYHPTNRQIIYFGNDGGMYKTTNGGGSFSPINNNLIITQFYSGAVHPSLDTYYGGTQDNGTLKSTSIPSWQMVFGGDGGETAVDYATPATVYTEYIWLCLQRSLNSGAGWTKIMNGIPTASSNQSDGTTDRCLFISPYVMDPSNSKTLVAGTFKVYRTTDRGDNWSSISNPLINDLTGDGDGSGQVGDNSKSSISSIAIAKSSSSTIYVGTSGSVTAHSKVWVTTNTGSNWTEITGSLPNRWVKAIAIDPSNRDRAFIGFSGYGTGHIYQTTNRGTGWADISGNLPDIPVNNIIINPVNASYLIVGTDLGIFMTTNSGSAWVQQNNGLANVSVADLELRSDGILFAATHGRGMFKTTVSVPVNDEADNIPDRFSLSQNYPNPFNPSTTISFTISEYSSVQLKVYDITGRLVVTMIDKKMSPGSYSSTFEASQYSSGIYFYVLKAGRQSITNKMMLIK